MKGLVVKKLADKFWIKTQESVFICVARGNLKLDGIFVGDYVEININNTPATIEKVEERKNLLIRPPLANLEQLIIVISPIPEPDYYIVDKLILFALSYGIRPFIVVNKQDLGQNEYGYVKKAYCNVVEKIINTDAKSGLGIDELKQILEGKLSAFAGQSAVGKSALINVLLGQQKTIEGALSTKIARGKNTTRHSEIFYSNNIGIADTSGFSSLDERLLPVTYFELPYYYPDFLKYMENCKFKSCSHITESTETCGVRMAVKAGLVDKQRYLRYKEIYNNLKEKWVKTHG